MTLFNRFVLNVILVAICAVGASRRTLAVAPLPLSGAEKWVVHMVNDDSIADLATPGHTGRVIRPQFIRRLLTNDLPGLRPGVLNVHIINAEIPGCLELSDSHINDAVWFESCKIGSIRITGSSFDQSVTLSGSHILGNSDFEGTRFSKSLFGVGTTFEGKANFAGIHVDGDIGLAKAIFALRSGEIDFSEVRLLSNAGFIGTTFGSAANFSSAECGGSIWFQNAKFKNRTGVNRFDGLAVGSGGYFQGARFYGPSSFRFMSIGKNLVLSTVKFLNTKASIPFNELHAGHGVLCSEVRFEGPAIFQDADIAGLATFNKCQFISDARFDRLHSGGALVLTEAEFRGNLTLEYANVQSVALTGCKISDPRNARLEGWTYSNMSADSERKLHDIICSMQFSRNNYMMLESYLVRQGDAQEATTVFLQRRLSESLYSDPWYEKFWDFVSCVTVGYGKLPGLAFLYAFAFVLYGRYVFREAEWMETKKTDDNGRYEYSPFWYSLSLFLPFVDLSSASVWKPVCKDTVESRYRLNYMRFHVLAGWVIIPIGLAAVTGLLK